MRKLELQGRQLIEQTAVDDAHRSHHQGEFPTQHPSEIVRVHGIPRDHPRQRVNEDVEPEVGGRLPEWPQALRVELFPLNLGCNDGPRETKVNCATLEFGCRRLRIQRRDVREPDEAAGMVALRLMQTVVDQPAGGKVGRVEARAAGQHRNSRSSC